MWAAVMESGFDECSLICETWKRATIWAPWPPFSMRLTNKPRPKHVLLDHVIRPFCSAHNTTLRGGRETSDISLPGPLCISPPVNSFFTAFVFSNWAPYCAVVSSGPLYNPHQQHNNQQIFRTRNYVFIIIIFFFPSKSGVNKTHIHALTAQGSRSCVCV